VEGSSARFECAAVAGSEATSVLYSWRITAEDSAEGSSSTNQWSLNLRESLMRLREALLARDNSFYCVRAIPNDCEVLMRARERALAVLDDPLSPHYEKNRATESLNSNHFLWMGVLAHDCSCPDYWLYGACKHALWATMWSTGQAPPANVDPRPLASRRRGGRPRRATSALQPMPTSQHPMI
jgi:hypothetical protein